MSNLYEIGVRMTMYQNVSPILTTLAHQFMHLHHHINHATAASQRFRQAVMGTVTAFAGIGLAKGVVGMIESGSHLLHVQQQMTIQGWKQKELAEATAKAYELSSKYQAVGVRDFLEMQKEMYPAIGDQHHTVELADLLGKFNVAARGVLGGEGAHNYARMIQEAVKSGEMSGWILQPEYFEKYIDSLQRALNLFGGTVTPHDYNMVMRGGKGAAMNWSMEFLSSVLPTLIQESGAGVGNSLFQMWSAIVGGRMLQRNALNFDEIGLIDHAKLDPKTDFTAEGRMKKASAGSVIGWEVFNTDPDKWMWEVLIPAMIKHSDKTHLTQEQWDAVKTGRIKEGLGHEGMMNITREFTKLFGRQTAQAVADVLATQYAKIQRDRHGFHGTLSLDETVTKLRDENWKYQIEAFHAQWENLMETMGAPHVGNAVGVMQTVNNALSSLAQTANANPNAVKAILAGLGMMAGVLVAVGTVLLGLAIGSIIGLPALIAAAIAGIVVGIAMLAAAKWDDIKAGINLLWVATKRIARDFVAAIKTIPGQIAGAIQSMAVGIASKIADGIRSIPSAIRDAWGWWKRLGTGEDAGSPNAIRPQTWVPPGGGAGGPRTIRTALVLDGRVLGEAVAQIIVRNGQFMGGSADFDGMASAMPADYSPI